MNQLIKNEWLNRLRSGKYEQADGVLHNKNNGSYCCLGVLCQIYIDEKNLSWNTKDDICNDDGMCNDEGDEDGNEDGLYLEGSFDFLPHSVKEWAELDSQNPEVSYDVTGHETPLLLELSELNDNHSLNFEDIADLIEAQL